MKYLQGERVFLRALEPGDLDFLYVLENEHDIWEISGTLKPYSKKVLRDYLVKAHLDIYEVKQLRLAICRSDEKIIGLVDLYDFDPRNLRAGIGIVISAEYRGLGYGKSALELLCQYAFEMLQLHQVYASVGASNLKSLELFKKLGFKKSGVRLGWLRTSTGFQDEVFLQKIREDVY